MVPKEFSTWGCEADSSLSTIGTWTEDKQLLATSVDETANHHFGG